jgi:hypothetical protein
MVLSYYAISLETSRMVANEVDSDEAAILLEAGHSILLAAPVDLVRVALRHQKPLKIFSREDVVRSSRPRSRPRSARGAKSRPASAVAKVREEPACSTAPWLRRRVLV